jgi:hypothetical protein
VFLLTGDVNVKNIFKRKGNKSTNNSEFLTEFHDTLENSIREEKTQVLMTKKLQSKLKAMVKVLLDHGFSLDEVNMFINSNKKYMIKDGQIYDDLS